MTISDDTMNSAAAAACELTSVLLAVCIVAELMPPQQQQQQQQRWRAAHRDTDTRCSLASLLCRVCANIIALAVVAQAN